MRYKFKTQNTRPLPFTETPPPPPRGVVHVFTTPWFTPQPHFFLFFWGVWGGVFFLVFSLSFFSFPVFFFVFLFGFFGFVVCGFFFFFFYSFQHCLWNPLFTFSFFSCHSHHTVDPFPFPPLFLFEREVQLFLLRALRTLALQFPGLQWNISNLSSFFPPLPGTPLSSLDHSRALVFSPLFPFEP